MGKSPHFSEEPKEPQARQDLRDTQGGVRGNEITAPDGEENLPEGLRRRRKGPPNRDAGRGKDMAK